MSASPSPRPTWLRLRWKRREFLAAAAIAAGDLPFDMESVSHAGIIGVVVRSGGFDDAALIGAGAAAIYDDVADRLRGFEGSLPATTDRIDPSPHVDRSPWA